MSSGKYSDAVKKGKRTASTPSSPSSTSIKPQTSKSTNPKTVTSPISNQDQIDNSIPSAVDSIISSPLVSSNKNLPSITDNMAPANGNNKQEDNSRDNTYFGYYAQLINQQNMLQDAVRTGTYQLGIVQNRTDFTNKVVLDVGAGSGILSFFAIQAGARKVYAVEASDVAVFAKQLVEANHLSDKIIVLQGKLEDIELPEKVDVIISEPMGVLLVHERMIETFIRARIKWLKPDGMMFPTTSSIFLAPFTDSYLYTETISKVRFWQQEDFYGVNLTSVANDAFSHHFGQPVVGCFDPRTLMSTAFEYPINFLTVSLEHLQAFEVPFRMLATYTGVCHGIAGWFDVRFQGTDSNICLSTSPFGQKTHWYQIRFLFKHPIAVNVGQALAGKLIMRVNDQRSYRVTIEVSIEKTEVQFSQVYQLHEQQYWYPTLPDPNTPVFPETNNLYLRNL